MTFRILVTGTRENNPRDRRLVHQMLDVVTIAIVVPIVIVHGQCPYGGVDRYAAEWAHDHPGATDEPHPAKIQGGRILGPERNSRMVALGANLCLGFPAPTSRGTWDCLRKAEKAGIPIRVYLLDGGEVIDG